MERESYLSDEGGKVRMFEIFGENLRTEKFLIFDNEGGSILRPGQNVRIL
jgi:hypothetical protein